MGTKDFNLERYLSNGVENIVKEAIKTTVKNPKESIFIAKYALASQKARKLREEAEKRGEHIPPFLIASITSKCNLHCAGCYARSNHSCHDSQAENQLSAKEWKRIFSEAKELGIGFILLAGGEPLMRKDVIQAAGSIPEILFPVFTNGTMIGEDYISIFSQYRNLVPVFSIEGNEALTDLRRGSGVHEKLMHAMDTLHKNNILYGASVTVTKENLKNVTGQEFLDDLTRRGCKVVFYVEYVPVSEETKNLALEEAERKYLTETLISLRKNHEEMIFISFPGDEKTSGGCLAAGRGFFHINSNGGAEPCPFSPYSDTNVRDIPLRDALKSPLFHKLQEQGVLMEDHVGGCVLFEKEDEVRKILL